MANYGPGAKSSPTPIFKIKVLLEHLFYSCFHATISVLSASDRDSLTCKAKTIYHQPFTEKVKLIPATDVRRNKHQKEPRAEDLATGNSVQEEAG